MNARNTSRLSSLTFTAAFIIVALSCYWFLAPWLNQHGFSGKLITRFNKLMLSFREFFGIPMKVKLTALALTVISSFTRTVSIAGKEWWFVLTYPIAAIATLLISPDNPFMYTFFALAGLMTTRYGLSLLVSKIKYQKYLR